MSRSSDRERGAIAAPPQACFDALTDYDHLPEWQGAVTSADVIERGEDGLATVVEYAVDAKLRTVRYRLRHDYDAPHRIGSTYLDGDFRDFAGEWRFTEREDGGTDAELSLTIDPGRLVPPPVRKVIREAVMTRAVRDLKRRVEADG